MNTHDDPNELAALPVKFLLELAEMLITLHVSLSNGLDEFNAIKPATK